MKIAIYNPYLHTLGGGENLLACLAEALELALPDATIDLLTHTEGVRPDDLSRRFDTNLTRCRVRVVPEPRGRLAGAVRRVDLARRYLCDRVMSDLSAEYDLFINLTIFSTMPCRARHGVYFCMFPLRAGRVTVPATHFSYLPRHINRALRQSYFHQMAHSYSEVLSISQFTQKWTKAYWGVDSTIIHPPIATRPQVDLAGKQARILSVGRFFAGNHNKKHRPMIETFIRLVDQGLSGWEYHLVGGISESEGTEAYVADLQRLAAGYPIHFHFGMPTEQLNDLYRTASVFWHATGFGEDEEAEPEKMEHFGISTVEAMNAGLVPVVINKGGQPEIVAHGRHGYVWNSLDELAAHTRAVIDDPSLRQALAEAAHARSLDFGRSAFRQDVARLVQRLLAAPLSSTSAEHP
jgi:glycosyltransferase involved in cell wall biosynthesis